MNVRQPVLIAVIFLGACVSAAPEPSPNVISGIWAPPVSLNAKADQVRADGGVVLLMRTVSAGDLELSDPTPVGVDGVFLRVQRRTFRVAVVDSLGEEPTEGSVFEVVGIAGPTLLTDAAGEPRTDWVISGDAPTTSRAPHEDSDWVLFGYATEPGALVLDFVAGVEGGIVDGTDTLGESVPLEGLRRSPSP